MYHFAIIALLGLAAYKTVDFLLEVSGIKATTAFKTLLTLGVGVLFTEILDYSVFSGWGVSLRDTWMGPVWTGLIVGGMAYVWPSVLGLIEGFGGRRGEDAERRTPRAA
jgi:hypothetical protein